MMYNLTYLGHRVTLPWLDLRSNFDPDLSRSNYTWFDAPWRDKHDGIKIVALPLKLKILLSKNRFGKFWIFDPWWRQFWSEPKNDRNDFEMIFRELSNAVFRFVLRCAGAEIDGGVFKHPPPPAGRGKSRGPAGRGLMSAIVPDVVKGTGEYITRKPAACKYFISTSQGTSGDSSASRSSSSCRSSSARVWGFAKSREFSVAWRWLEQPWMRTVRNGVTLSTSMPPSSSVLGLLLGHGAEWKIQTESAQSGKIWPERDYFGEP